MGRKVNDIISFRNLEIGFESGRIKRSLIAPFTGLAREGELVGLIGKNGIGKSTLLRTLAGLQIPLSGELLIDGKNISNYSRNSLSRKTGFVSTEIVRVSNMKVYDLVSLGRFPHTGWLGTIMPDDHEIISDAISKTGLAAYMNRPVTELSDGERQRAMIAMVLAQDAGIMLMDEPTAFLDISSKFDIMHLLHELTRNRRKTVIFSTHDLSMAIRQVDKIWILTEKGLIEGAPEDVMIDKQYRELFDESKVTVNPLDGSFEMHHNETRKVSLKGDGILRYWTEKALLREGFTFADSESVVEVPSEPGQKWKISTPFFSGNFKSIYDLMAWLRENKLTF